MTNYFQEYNKIIDGLASEKKSKKLLLHCCCAPCSTTALERVTPIFDTAVFYFNPNITGGEEYAFRLDEQKRFLSLAYPDVKLIEGRYDISEFFGVAKGLENLPERSQRCFMCYKLRLEETARVSKELGFDYFATTLTLSPHKNSDWLNEIGYGLQNQYGVSYLPTDFKKENGYLRSIELSKEYNLYRQNYCGCVFSKRS